MQHGGDSGGTQQGSHRRRRRRVIDHSSGCVTGACVGGSGLPEHVCRKLRSWQAWLADKVMQVTLVGRTSKTPPKGDAPKPITDTSRPVLPSFRRGSAELAMQRCLAVRGRAQGRAQEVWNGSSRALLDMQDQNVLCCHPSASLLTPLHCFRAGANMKKQRSESHRNNFTFARISS